MSYKITKGDWDFLEEGISDEVYNQRFIKLSQRYLSNINPNLLLSIDEREKYYWAVRFIKPSVVRPNKDKWCLSLMSKDKKASDEERFKNFYGVLNLFRNDFRLFEIFWQRRRRL